MTNYKTNRYDFGRDYAGDDGDLPVFGVESGAPEKGVSVLENAYKISLDRISADEQIRKDFDPEELDALAASLRENGLIQPIVVKKHEDGYKIIAGERRYRAAHLAGWTEIACIVSDGDILTQISENIFRVNLNALEEAKAYQAAMDELGLDGKQLAMRLGLDPSTVTTSTRILKLPPDILNLVAEGKISKTAVRQIQKIKDEDKQRGLVNDYLQTGSLTDIENKVSKKKRGQSPARGVKKTATIDEINFTASSRKKKTLAELARAARQFAEQIESQIRSRAA